MKVSELKPEKLAIEMKKNLRVQALGDRAVYVGYYNHLRRRGGDIFVLRPVIRDRKVLVRIDKDPITNKDVKIFKMEKMLITAEQQFSEKWMTKVKVNLPETPPAHFNQVGGGRKRFDIPGMTKKVGGENDNSLNDTDDSEADVSDESVVDNANNESVI